MLALLMSAGKHPVKVQVSRSLFLNDCYSYLDCDFIETLNVKTQQGRVLIVCDEEALIKDKVPRPSVALADLGTYIFGSCLVFGYNPKNAEDPFTDIPASMLDALVNAPLLVV